MSRRLAAVVLALAAATASTGGCTTALGRQADSGDQKNFIEGDGSYRYIPPAHRGKPVDLTGTTTSGSRLDVAAWRGDVVVVNVWYAACGPCRAEAPDLAALARSSGAHVHFVGINTEDDVDDVKAFDAQYGIPYPSILDHRSGAAVLALRGTLPPSSTPSTIVLDTKGRPAARVVGRIPTGVLGPLIQDVQQNTLHPHVTYRPTAPASSSATTSGAAS